jgi:hypothetical protein
VNGDDADVFGQVFIESLYLRGFARGLAADNCANLCCCAVSRLAQEHSINSRRHTRTESLYNRVDILRLDAVDDEIAASGHEMTTLHNLNFGLALSQHAYSLWYIEVLSYKVLELFHQRIELVRQIAGVDPSKTTCQRVRSRRLVSVSDWLARFMQVKNEQCERVV